jgi:hypothetical protein
MLTTRLLQQTIPARQKHSNVRDSLLPLAHSIFLKIFINAEFSALLKMFFLKQRTVGASHKHAHRNSVRRKRKVTFKRKQQVQLCTELYSLLIRVVNKVQAFKIIYPVLLSQCCHWMYQVNSLAIHDITITSLRHVSAWQYHLQGVHMKLKTIYSKMEYIYEFQNRQYNLLLIPVSVWVKYVNFLMYCRHYV